MKAHARFDTVWEETNDDKITIRDRGPWHIHPTITNDVEYVIEYLHAMRVLSNGRRLFYYDSEGQRDEILHENGVFKGFETGGAQ